MSDEAAKTEPAKKESKAPAPKAPSGPPVEKLPVERLIADSARLLGQPSWVAAGALSGTEGSITIEQAQQAVSKFLSTEIKEG